MAFRRGRAQAREQAFFIEKRNRRYKLLNDMIFRGLANKSIRLGNNRATDMSLSYDISEITNSFYYDEAKEHLKEDLPEELVKPEDLQNEVNSYNTELNDLTTRIIPTRIKKRFENIMSITERQEEYGNNSIHFANIIELIQQYWLSNIDRELVYKNDGQLWADGEKAVAMIPRESQDKVKKVIDDLKKDSILNSILNGTIGTGGLRSKRNELIQKGRKLGKDIQDSIVFKIDSEQYETTCNFCPKDHPQTDNKDN